MAMLGEKCFPTGTCSCLVLVMDESEEMIAGFFHLTRSLRRERERQEKSRANKDDPIMRAILNRIENERRRALRQARLEWAEDRDEWERRWR
ncbi:hypothetical protein [Sphingomonas sp. 2378]|uniref:hypothetical protein n=1 Tax=Sphingomonas sp. 2378 TaxID=1219748 RepID=UPI00311ADEE3